MYPAPARQATQGRTEEIIGAWLANNRQHRDRLVIASKIRGPGEGEWIRGGDPHVSKTTIPRRSTTASRGCGPTISTCIKSIGRNDMCRISASGASILRRSARPFPSSSRSRHGGGDGGRQDPGLWPLQRDELRRLRIRPRRARERLPPPASVQNGYNLVSAHGGRRAGGDEPPDRRAISGLWRARQGPAERQVPRRGAPLRVAPGQIPAPRRALSAAARLAAAEAYGEIAERHALPLAGLALAFVRSRFFVRSTVIGGTSIAQLEELARHVDVALPPEALVEIEAVHAACPSPSAQ